MNTCVSVLRFSISPILNTDKLPLFFVYAQYKYTFAYVIIGRVPDKIPVA